jgi:integrase/recombinase XerD
VASAKATVTGLRALLRFLYLDGQIAMPLAGAVPSAACWQLAALPRAVSPADLARIVESCDRRRVAGRRDYAIIVLLARLGLRAGEVAALDLGDIGWRQGEITIRGKGSRRDILPLPADAGEAVAGWLAEGRPPDTGCPAVFVQLRPPHGRLASTSVSYVVRRASVRAGVAPAGAHRLRHATAVRILAAGGNPGRDRAGPAARRRKVCAGRVQRVIVAQFACCEDPVEEREPIDGHYGHPGGGVVGLDERARRELEQACAPLSAWAGGLT